jgi:hypothetical protein
MAVKLVRLIHKIAIQLHLVAESCTIYSSRSRWPVRKLLDTPSFSSYAMIWTTGLQLPAGADECFLFAIAFRQTMGLIQAPLN